MSTTVRQPKQERAIEKKNKIIEAGYKMFSEKDYFSCTTPDIAKRAGVSTGIVYGYFSDKHDILLQVLKIYIDEVSAPLMEIIRRASAPIDAKNLIKELLDKTIEMHKSHKVLHETLHSLAASDKSVYEQFLNLENHITMSIANVLPEKGIVTTHAEEKVHLAMNLIQSFSHEFVFDNHAYIDYSTMYELVCNMAAALFNN